MITIISLQMRNIVAGAVIIENVFNIPGIGQMLVSGVQQRDYFMLFFALMLLGGIAVDISVLYALSGGLICFCIYTLYSKYTLRDLAGMIWKGVKDSKTILLVFVLIGFLTASWRASGTIPCIVYYSALSMVAQYYLVLTFILCCGMSLLTGTSFGTVSTMGVICAGVGRALGVSELYIGGAVLSGIYLGEQCSPMSSSALLVCELTGTNIYTNIAKVIKNNCAIDRNCNTIFMAWRRRNISKRSNKYSNCFYVRIPSGYCYINSGFGNYCFFHFSYKSRGYNAG